MAGRIGSVDDQVEYGRLFCRSLKANATVV